MNWCAGVSVGIPRPLHSRGYALGGIFGLAFEISVNRMYADMGCDCHICRSGRAHNVWRCDSYVLVRPEILSDAERDTLADLNVLERDPLVLANAEFVL